MPDKLILALRAFLALLLIVFGCLLAYTFLHESGHALTALSVGGSVTDFNLNFFDLSAHVSLAGDFTTAQRAWINISGAALPFGAWLILMLALPKQGAPPLLQIIKGIASLITVNTLLAWIALPMLHLLQCAPPGDDVTQFLVHSQAAPFTVTLGASALYAFGWFITARQIDQPRAALSVFLKTPIPNISSPVVVLLVAAAALLIVLSSMSISICAEQSRIPAGFTLINTLDLSTQDFDEEPLASFTLTTPERVGFWLRAQSLETTYLAITVKKINGPATTLLYGEDLTATESTSEVNLMLGAGDYQVLLTSKQSTGNLKLYLKRP